MPAGRQQGSVGHHRSLPCARGSRGPPASVLSRSEGPARVAPLQGTKQRQGSHRGVPHWVPHIAWLGFPPSLQFFRAGLTSHTQGVSRTKRARLPQDGGVIRVPEWESLQRHTVPQFRIRPSSLLPPQHPSPGRGGAGTVFVHVDLQALLQPAGPALIPVRLVHRAASLQHRQPSGRGEQRTHPAGRRRRDARRRPPLGAPEGTGPGRGRPGRAGGLGPAAGPAGLHSAPETATAAPPPRATPVPCAPRRVPSPASPPGQSGAGNEHSRRGRGKKQSCRRLGAGATRRGWKSCWLPVDRLWLVAYRGAAPLLPGVISR